MVSFTFQEGAFSQSDVFSQIPFPLANLALEINFDLSGVRNEFVLRKINKKGAVAAVVFAESLVFNWRDL